MPPKMDVLPAPRDRLAKRPAKWPADANVGVRRTDRFDQDPNGPGEKPKLGFMERVRGKYQERGAGSDDQPGPFQ